MSLGLLILCLLLAALPAGVAYSAAPQAANAGPADNSALPRTLALDNPPWTGDFGGMLERRMVRILVPYSRTLFFHDHGTERGLSAELARDFERYLNRTVPRAHRPVTVYLIPTPRDRLLPDLLAGIGDIAIGNLTVTEQRLERVDFVAPDGVDPQREILVVHRGVTAPSDWRGLAGQSIPVRPGSSYHASLEALNARLIAEQLAPVDIMAVPEILEDEDLLEMLNAGMFDGLVVDSWMANIWTDILPDIVAVPNIVLRDDGRTGWATRPDSPELTAVLERFYRDYVKAEHIHRIRLADYHKRLKRLYHATAPDEQARFHETLSLFQKYGERYHFDPVMLAAQGYQESRLQQSARSPAGAVGIMQLLPATGAQMAVGDIHQTEANIHAGVKYLDHLLANYLGEATFDDNNRLLFALASYNAGPGNMRRIRRLAEQRGLDPNQWFLQAEIAAAERLGQETVQYVRNIYKYYVAYTLSLEMGAARQASRQSLLPESGAKDTQDPAQ